MSNGNLNSNGIARLDDLGITTTQQLNAWLTQIKAGKFGYLIESQGADEMLDNSKEESFQFGEYKVDVHGVELGVGIKMEVIDNSKNPPVTKHYLLPFTDGVLVAKFLRDTYDTYIKVAEKLQPDQVKDIITGIEGRLGDFLIES